MDTMRRSRVKNNRSIVFFGSVKSKGLLLISFKSILLIVEFAELRSGSSMDHDA